MCVCLYMYDACMYVLINIEKSFIKRIPSSKSKIARQDEEDKGTRDVLNHWCIGNATKLNCGHSTKTVVNEA